MPEPTHPTAAEVIALILQVYRPEGLSGVLNGRCSALGDRRPVDLLDTVEGRREVAGWALSLAEGVFT